MAIAVGAAACTREAEPVDRLDELGFFEHASDAQREAAREDARAHPRMGVFSERTRRFYVADAEDLAEGGVGVLLEELEPLLRELGVPSLAVREASTDTDYRVTVNGRSYLIYNAKELQSDLFWGYGAGRTARIVNDLLEGAGSDERAYGYADPASNDFSFFILTPALRDAVAEILPGTADDPFVVTDEEPSFGYPGWNE